MKLSNKRAGRLALKTFIKLTRAAETITMEVNETGVNGIGKSLQKIQIITSKLEFL